MQQIEANSRFGMLTVIGEIHPKMRKGKDREVLAACDCGNRARITLYNLRRTQSCGCHRSRTLARTGVSSRSREYMTWASMKDRCLNPKNKRWAGWGGRGIRVCDRWMDFALFLKDMGRKPTGMSLERINNDGNYEPGNCRWATPKEQANNRAWGEHTILRCMGNRLTQGARLRCTLPTGHEGPHIDSSSTTWERCRPYPHKRPT